MSYDLVIRNGFVVDGTGAPGFAADVAVNAGIIAAIAAVGTIEGDAETVVDAQGHVVTPGFVDIHTHYDAQICWDPILSPSAEHGVTTVVFGNCGIGVAPSLPEHREINALDLVSLEGMSIEVLKAGVTWDWESFESYMDYVQMQNPGINISFLIPLAAVRRYVMGDAAIERVANDDETTKIANLLESAMRAGANGFSTTTVARQKGWQGKPLACTLTSMQELQCYARVLKKVDRGVIQMNCANKLGTLSDAEFHLIDTLMKESGRPVSWSGAVSNSADGPDAFAAYLKKIEPLVARGGKPQGTSRPLTVEVGLKNPFFMTDLETGQKVLGQDTELQLGFYADPAYRREVLSEWEKGSKFFSAAWVDCQVLRVANPNMKQYLRRTVREIATERGADPIDTFFDLAIEDDLNLKYLGAIANAEEEHVREQVNDDRILLGMSDGGAHVDMLLESNYTTYILGHWVREKQAMSLERAVHRITGEPADLFGITDRGRLAVGLAADITIFDKDRVGSAMKATEIKHDLPAGGERLYIAPNGIDYVIVNGAVLYDHGEATSNRAGQVLRT
ncbi:MAG: N-acyl-D-amino-acid deacylase [Gammaproteobacteria bacterium]|jgi:N-acyl-D-amino-acid deacylase